MATVHGLGNHLANLTLDQIGAALMWTWVSIFIGLVALTFAKWAIIALLLQVEGPNKRKRKIFLWSLGAILGIVAVVQFVLSWTQCTPAARLYDLELPGECPGAELALHWGYL